jgi:signal transduction histidine kinase
MKGPSDTELDRLKAAFLAIISHELRTPLTEIIAATSILGDGYLGTFNEDQQRYLEMIENSAEHLNQLLQDLLSFSQLQSEIVETLREPTDLNEVARAAMDLYRGQMEQKKLQLVTRLTPGLAPLLLDRVKILRVFSNLISNGVKFTREGGRIMVRTRAVDVGEVFEVADTGIGIPRSKQARLFESFYQAEEPLTRDVGGLGIGLAYARRIVEAHGGRTTFESVEGQGSLFCVWLPPHPDSLGHGPVKQRPAR